VNPDKKSQGPKAEDYKAIKLLESIDLSHFNFVSKPFATRSLRFGSRTISQRLKPGVRSSISMESTDYVCHIYIKKNGLAAVVVTSVNYPANVALAMCSQVLHVYRTEKGGKYWQSVSQDESHNSVAVQNLLKTAQDPTQASKLQRVQAQVDQIKNIVTKDIELLLRNGESIEDLMDKSEDLENSSKAFLKKTKKMNKRCCVVM
jgi:synaptobrevin family protein YKT6